MGGKVSFSGDRVVVIESLEFYSQARRITNSSPPLTLAPSLQYFKNVLRSIVNQLSKLNKWRLIVRVNNQWRCCRIPFQSFCLFLKCLHFFNLSTSTGSILKAQWKFFTPCWSFFLWLTPAAARPARMQIGGILLTERDGLIVITKINTWLVFGGMMLKVQMMVSIS